jgi:hypothetical protein
MHPSNHVHRSHRPAAARVAIAIVGGALLCTATTGPALASARHSHSHSSHTHKSRSHKPAVHKPAAHKSAKPSAPSSASGGWVYYTVLAAQGKTPQYELAARRDSNGDLSLNVYLLGSAGSAPKGGVIKPGPILLLPASGSTATGTGAHASAQPPRSAGWADSYTIPTAQAGESQLLDELIVKRAGNGDLSLNVFQLGSGGSAPHGSDVIKPGWILVLPANGSAPAAPTGPLAEAPQASVTPIAGLGTPSASLGTASGTKHSAIHHDGTGQRLTSAVVPTSTRLARAGEIGGIVLIALLVAVWVLIKRRRRGGKRGSTAGAPPSPRLTGDPRWVVDDTGPARTPLKAAPVPALSGGGAGLDDASWPDYLVPAGQGAVAAVRASAAPSPQVSPRAGYRAADHPLPSVCAQRHHVVSGDDQIDVMLAQGPATGQGGGSAWLATSPYLVWTPLPYDIPEDGVAFACLGTGDEGCLFIDLAAAPGVISIGGDRAAAARLAESIAHQMSMAGDDGHLAVTVVGDAVPGPLPAGITQVATVSSLGPAGPGETTGIVFCTPRSDEDTFALARYAAAAQHRVIPVVLADVPDASWSFTAQPSLRPSQPLAG